MKSASLALTLLLLLLAGCSGGRATQEDVLAVIPQIVDFMEKDARANMLGRPSEGPLWIDARGFGATIAQLTKGDTLPRTRIMETIGRGRQAEPRQVLLIDEESGFGGTWVREYGIYISPNVARGTATQITVLVVNYVTDRRIFPTDICDRVWRLRYTRGAEGRWTLSDQVLRRDCREDDPM